MSDIYFVKQWSETNFFASKGPNSLGALFVTRDAAQKWCDDMNRSIALNRRKDAALDWAIANGVPTREIWDTIDEKDGKSLLDYEAMMADSPLVVG